MFVRPSIKNENDAIQILKRLDVLNKNHVL